MMLHTLGLHALAQRFFQLDNRIDGPKVTSGTNVISDGPLRGIVELENFSRYSGVWKTLLYSGA